jgi:hypothetical protein
MPLGRVISTSILVFGTKELLSLYGGDGADLAISNAEFTRVVKYGMNVKGG